MNGGVARIGTAEGSDLRLSDRMASRVHCEIRVKATTIVVRDAGSTNGTLCEGVRIFDAEVPAGAMLRIGATSVRVEVGDEPAFVEVSPHESFGELVGTSFEMRRLYAMLERVATSDTPVLVQGETGTGKDVVARSIHAASGRRDQPFVPLDCGAVPEALFESELFEHVRGAFSGAVADRKGVIEEADGGTLFLDEIGELPLGMQAKLLRAIETRSVRRVGANTAKAVNVRIVAATNRPLGRAVNEGTFREDLYYRLAVVEVALPPLRFRRDDIPMLAAHFYRSLGGQGDLPQAFLAMVSQRSFPGNVRELRNFVERAMLLGTIAPPLKRAPIAAPKELGDPRPASSTAQGSTAGVDGELRARLRARRARARQGQRHARRRACGRESALPPAPRGAPRDPRDGRRRRPRGHGAGRELISVVDDATRLPIARVGHDACFIKRPALRARMRSA